MEASGERKKEGEIEERGRERGRGTTVPRGVHSIGLRWEKRVCLYVECSGHSTRSARRYAPRLHAGALQQLRDALSRRRIYFATT